MIPMIEISEAAARHLRELAAEKGAGGLRLGVEKGGVPAFNMP